MATYQSILDEHLTSKPIRYAAIDDAGKVIVGTDGKPGSVLTFTPSQSKSGGIIFACKAGMLGKMTRAGESLQLKHSGMFITSDLDGVAGADEARSAAKAAQIEKAKADAEKAAARLQALCAKLTS